MLHKCTNLCKPCTNLLPNLCTACTSLCFSGIHISSYSKFVQVCTNFCQSSYLIEKWFGEFLSFSITIHATNPFNFFPSFHWQMTTCHERRKRIIGSLNSNASLIMWTRFCQSLQWNGTQLQNVSTPFFLNIAGQASL